MYSTYAYKVTGYSRAIAHNNASYVYGDAMTDISVIDPKELNVIHVFGNKQFYFQVPFSTAIEAHRLPSMRLIGVTRAFVGKSLCVYVSLY